MTLLSLTNDSKIMGASVSAWLRHAFAMVKCWSRRMKHETWNKKQASEGGENDDQPYDAFC